MLPKKPPLAAFPSSSSLLPAFHPSTSVAPPCWPRDRRGRQHRSYASVHDGNPSQNKGHDASHPPKWPSSARPTPYEILGLARDAPYSKARYFELAKLYHPDRRHHTSDDGISHVTKLERYRLVVAANEILSNPQKKRMYDLYGIGWHDPADVHAGQQEAYRAWRQDPSGNAMNGTWEDWERYYQQRDGTGEKQEQVFTSNLGFMAIISLFLIVGTWGQVTRAGTNSVTLLEMRDQKHAAISKELRERQMQRRGMDREGRVESFLRQREFEKWAYDPPGHGLPAPQDRPSG